MSTLQIVEGGYLRDILAQPAAVQATLAGLALTPAAQAIVERARRREFTHVVLTGMGGSFWALHPLALRLLNLGWPVVAIETSELIHAAPGILDSCALVVAVSQSGRSAEIVRLLDPGRPRPVTLAVTNTPDSPLACNAEAAILTRAGEEFTVSCKTWVASVAALGWFGAVLAGENPAGVRRQLDEAVPAMAGYLEQWRERVEEAAAAVSGAERLFYLGRGDSLAAAGTGALITKESARFGAEGMSSAAFRHGPLEMVGAGLFAVVFEGEAWAAPLNANLVRDIRQAGGGAALVSARAELPLFRLPRVSALARPLLEILPVQMITLALAALQGREAGRFERATKVTASE